MRVNKIRVENFKNFKTLQIENFGRFNIIIGPNDSGKTNLLEAIFLGVSFEPNEPRKLLKVFRGFPIEERTSLWNLLPYQLNWEYQPEIEIEFFNKQKLRLVIFKNLADAKEYLQEIDINQLIWKENSLLFIWKLIGSEKILEKVLEIVVDFEGLKNSFPFPIKEPLSFISLGKKLPIKIPVELLTSCSMFSIESLNHIYGLLVSQNLKEKLIEALRAMEEDIEDVDIITMGDVQSVGIKISGKYYPITTFGEGFKKIFVLIGFMVKNRNGVLLIDEIENGVYYEIQPSLWKKIVDFAYRFNVQVFITTHSYEFLKNAFKILEGKALEDTRLIKLFEEKQPFVLDGISAKPLIEQNIEVR